MNRRGFLKIAGLGLIGKLTGCFDKGGSHSGNGGTENDKDTDSDWDDTDDGVRRTGGFYQENVEFYSRMPTCAIKWDGELKPFAPIYRLSRGYLGGKRFNLVIETDRNSALDAFRNKDREVELEALATTNTVDGKRRYVSSGMAGMVFLIDMNRLRVIPGRTDPVFADPAVTGVIYQIEPNLFLTNSIDISPQGKKIALNVMSYDPEIIQRDRLSYGGMGERLERMFVFDIEDIENPSLTYVSVKGINSRNRNLAVGDYSLMSVVSEHDGGENRDYSIVVETDLDTLGSYGWMREKISKGEDGLVARSLLWNWFGNTLMAESRIVDGMRRRDVVHFAKSRLERAVIHEGLQEDPWDMQGRIYAEDNDVAVYEGEGRRIKVDMSEKYIED